MLGAAILDLEIERLLTGAPVESGGLSDLARFVEMLRAYGTRTPSEAEVHRFAASAAAFVGPADPSTAAVSRSRDRTRRRWRALAPQMAAAMMVVVFLTGATGVAVASDSAVPGDDLYGIDRALEEVGIGAGGAEERLDEANLLVADGRAPEALRHAAEVFEGEDAADLEEAAIALEEAADELLDAEQSAEGALFLQEKVADLLSYIDQNMANGVGADGKEFGQGVAELARGISAEGTGEAPEPVEIPIPDDNVQTQPDVGSEIGSGNGDGNGHANGAGHANANGNGNGNGHANGNGNGNSNGHANGNGPPPGSPSETAPGRGNKP